MATMVRVNLATLVGRADNRVLKPGTFHDVYADPADEFARMARWNVLQRLAHGYYVVVPEERRDGHRQPELEAIAIGNVVADYGRAVTAHADPPRLASTGQSRERWPRDVACPRTARSGRPRSGASRRSATRKPRRAAARHAGYDRLDSTTERTVLDIADRPAQGRDSTCHRVAA